MKFSSVDIQADDYRDDVGQLVKNINQIPNLTAQKKELVTELQDFAINRGYINFSAGNHRWHIGRVGQSYLYRVPSNKTGLLAQFRGKVVRVICVGSGTRWIRSYVAGPVCSSDG